VFLKLGHRPIAQSTEVVKKSVMQYKLKAKYHNGFFD
jgi:hypothetical protein